MVGERAGRPAIGKLTPFSVNSVLVAKKILYSLVLGSSVCHTVSAQIATDGSLGNQISITGPDYQILQSSGQVRGNNLFHSFAEFSLGLNESATFESHASIQNILARVTGGQISTIAGALNADANLFLINPAGIVFAQGSSLNISGDFSLSTANYVRFDDDLSFYSDLNQTSSLSYGSPIAFGFFTGGDSAINIGNTTLSLTGSQQLNVVTPSLSIINSNLNVESGRIALAAINSAGEFSLQQANLIGSTAQGNIFVSNSFINNNDSDGKIFIRGGQIVVESGSGIEVASGGVVDSGQNIDIQANRLLLGDGSYIRGNLLSTTDHLELNNNGKIISDGNIEINTQALNIFGGSKISSDTIANNSQSANAGSIFINASQILIDSVGSNAVTGITSDTIAFLPNDIAGDGGNITINANDLVLRNNSTISANSLSDGDAGSITVNTNNLRVADSASISSSSLNNLANAGSAGAITVNAEEMDVENLGRIRITTQGSGDGGSLVINTESLNIQSGGSIQASSFGLTSDAGDVGSIAITADNLTLSSGGAIVANTEGGGNGSFINIDAQEISLDRGIITSQSKSTGEAGTINVNSSNLQLANFSQIASDTTGANLTTGLGGKAGNINVFVQNLALSNQSSISNSSDSSGSAGQLSINASSILLDRNSNLSVSSNGNSGDVGNLSIFSIDLNVANGSAILARNGGSGSPGSINIYSRNLNLLNSAQITTFSTGAGPAGDIFLSAEMGIHLEQNSSISSASIFSGGGDISLSASYFLRLTDSEITTSVPAGVANGGNIDIDPLFVILDNSQITARAFGGSGGNIAISSDYLFQSGISTIDATSDLGADGILSISSPANELDKELVYIDIELVDAASWLAEPCAQRRTGNVSSLVVNASEGGFVNPTSLLVGNLLFNEPVNSDITVSDIYFYSPSSPDEIDCLASVF